MSKLSGASAERSEAKGGEAKRGEARRSEARRENKINPPPTPPHTPPALDRFSPLNENQVKSLLPLRTVDSRTGNRDDTICTCCGETFPTAAALLSHVNYNAMIEECDENIKSNDEAYFGRRHCDMELYKNPRAIEELGGRVKAEGVVGYMRRWGVEIIVLCEAIDPLLSGTFVGMHSYTWEDVETGRSFMNCVGVREVGVEGEGDERDIINKSFIDMSKFHETVPVGGRRGSTGGGSVDFCGTTPNEESEEGMRRRLTRRDSNLNRMIRTAFLN